MSRILIVEDSPTQSAQLQMILEAEGFEVVAVKDAEAALEVFTSAFDMVISDIVMPGRSGYEQCAEIKSTEDGQNTPVILLSTLSDPMNIIRGLECGADNFVTKPYEPDQLIARINTVLANRRLRGGGKVKLGIEVLFLGKKFSVNSDKEQILDLLMATFEDIVRTNHSLEESQAELAAAKSELERHAETLEQRIEERTRDLRDQQEQLSRAQAIAQLGSWRLMVDSDAVAWSDELFRIFGVEKLQDTQHLDSILKRVHPDDRTSVVQALDQARIDHQTFRCEFRIYRPDGELRYCWIEGQCEFGADGEITALFGICQDVTELKMSEIALQESNERYRQAADSSARAQAFLDLVIENIPDMLLVEDARDHRVVLVNKAAEEYFGTRREEVIGKTYEEFIPSGNLEPVIAKRNRVWETSAAVVVPEEEVNVPGRGRRLLRVTSTPVFGGDDAPRFLLTLLQDITDRKNVELQLHQSQKMEAVGQLTGGLAHDFNNLLTVIIANLDLLQEKLGDSPDEASLVDTALSASLRGADLTRQLLAFSRKQSLAPRSMCVSEVVEGMSALLQRTLGDDVEVDLRMSEDNWPVKADLSQLESALLNLAINARDAMPGGRKLTIETSNATLDSHYAAANQEVEPGEYVVLAVTDTGTGIPAELLPRVCEPFFTTKDVGQGTGLGLSMVYGFAKQSEGHLKIYSEEGHGTTVRLYLPRAQEGPARVPDLLPEREQHPASETILVVEDNPDVRATVMRQLGDMGYSVLEAADGKSALDVLETSTAIDLLFSDIVMPGGINGIELARRAAELRPGLKVLLTSGFTEASIEGNDNLPEDVKLLSKPYRQQELAKKLRQAIGDEG